MNDPIDRRRLVIVTATALEAKAVRRALPDVRVYEAGIGLSKLSGERFENVDSVISCGLAGGLRERLASGTVLIPAEVGRPDGTVMRCDAALVAALTRAARNLGHEVLADPLLTSGSIVRGAERRIWASAGYAGVDMETGELPTPRVAAVRVVLDTPERELRADWLHPSRALSDPRNWPEALWLAREAPRYARQAAAIVAAACALVSY